MTQFIIITADMSAHDKAHNVWDFLLHTGESQDYGFHVDANFCEAWTVFDEMDLDASLSLLVLTLLGSNRLNVLTHRELVLLQYGLTEEGDGSRNAPPSIRESSHQLGGLNVLRTRVL